jgi:DNA mismatch repair protein MutS
LRRCEAVREQSGRRPDQVTRAACISRLSGRLRRGFPFPSLQAEANELSSDLSKVNYCVLIKDGSFNVRGYEGELDYSTEIEETFKKFQQGAVEDYRIKYRNAPTDMNHIEAKVLEFVARLNLELFSRLRDYSVRNASFQDPAVVSYDREIHFYVGYLNHISRFKQAGLQFCYPQMSDTSKEVHATEAFDLALAQKLTPENRTVVFCHGAVEAAKFFSPIICLN